MPGACVICGGELLPTPGRGPNPTVCCGPECGRVRHNQRKAARRAARRAVRVPRACLACGREFVPAHGKMLCCSEECQRSRRNAKKRMNRSKRMMPADPLREAFERSGMTKSDLCRAVGFVQPNGKADTSRLTRMLHGQIRLSSAIRLLDPLRLDPVDVGI